MATQARSLSMPMATPQEASGGFITQFLRLFFQPVAFFKAMPGNHQWVVVMLLVLFITGYTATTQIQSTAASGGSTTTTQTSGFDLSLLDASSSQNGAASSTTATAAQTQSDASVSSDTLLMNALIAASGMLVVWFGQTMMLSLVSMLRGYAPRVGRSFQIAVWASLPLALMLILRHIHYSTGGSGGTLGLTLLLDDWSGYSTLTDYGQRIVTQFMSTLTLFWLWNVLLLYSGARYALGGRRLASMIVILLWVVASTMIPALVSEPETQTAPRVSISTTDTTQNSSDTSSSTTQTQQQVPSDFQGGNFSGGNNSGGGPPSGGNFPSGGGAPPGG